MGPLTSGRHPAHPPGPRAPADRRRGIALTGEPGLPAVALPLRREPGAPFAYGTRVPGRLLPARKTGSICRQGDRPHARQARTLRATGTSLAFREPAAV